ncbi:hypothetical protein BDY17DRAFT_304264 [Neohortaea acidophila]|uniref:Secreted protein n=1 Tax=Neohortaea acidophila TaxID=245834 RepID=A0A6A6PHW5_9PEZI|nr:uncharacterized protein BDY17DRAFT_304264 [Neohortaea acidophila]KAF2479599.1 hypothetical protein BDY17DRAFT_304264 [Neohortaea acidophila]
MFRLIIHRLWLIAAVLFDLSHPVPISRPTKRLVPVPIVTMNFRYVSFQCCECSEDLGIDSSGVALSLLLARRSSVGCLLQLCLAFGGEHRL